MEQPQPMQLEPLAVAWFLRLSATNLVSKERGKQSPPPQQPPEHAVIVVVVDVENERRRFLQCIRRYKDTRNIFPHLVNCGKYTASILAGVFLSVYRIDNTRTHLALFVAFSTINGLYTGKRNAHPPSPSLFRKDPRPK